MLAAVEGTPGELLVISQMDISQYPHTFVITRLDETGTTITTQKVNIDTRHLIKSGSLEYLAALSDGRYLAYFEVGSDLLVCFISSQGEASDIRLHHFIEKHHSTGREVISDGAGGAFILIQSGNGSSKKLELFRINSDGSASLHNRYFTNFDIPEGGYGANITKSSDYTYISIGISDMQSRDGGSISRLNESGEIINSIFIESQVIRSITTDLNGNVYALSDNMLMKFDQDLVLVWAKIINLAKGRSLDGAHSKLVCNDYNDLFIAINGSEYRNSNGLRLLKINSTGQFISGDIILQESRNFFTTLNGVHDGLINISTTYTGKAILQKFDSNGHIHGCPSQSLCVDLVDTNIVVLNIDVEYSKLSLPSWEYADFSINDATFELENYCNPLPEPSGEFDLTQDTICHGDVVEIIPESVYPLGGSEWIIKIDNQIVYQTEDNLPNDYLLTKPGEYTIVHHRHLTNCVFTDSLRFYVLEEAAQLLEDSLTICDDETINLKLIVDSIIQLTNDSVHDIQESSISLDGNYTVHYIASDGCEVREDFVVQKKYSPIIDLGPDTSLCAEESFILTIDDFSGSDILWTDGSAGNSKVIVSSGVYGAYVKNECGSFYDEINIKFEDCSANIYVPTAFSPNDDNINDALYVFAKNVELRSLSIYTRWGELVYKEEGHELSWDGNASEHHPAPIGTYVYVLEYFDENGSLSIATGSFVLL